MQTWVNLYRDILHIYFSPYYRMLSSQEFKKVAPIGFLRQLKLALKIIQQRVFQLLTAGSGANQHNQLDGKLWLFAVSKNNLDTLHFIHNAFQDSIFVLDKDRREFSACRSIVPKLRFQILYLYKYFFIWTFIVRREGNYARRLSPVILRSIGFYEEWLRILKKSRPKAIVFANDHNIESRSILLAAGRLNIPTIYLQHASVSTSFPPLKFDLNLLEGQDTLEKYKQIGSVTGRVVLVGMPKFDRFLKYRRSITNIKNIGIPYNLNDDIRILEQLIVALHENFPDKCITVRKHPKDKSDFSFVKRFPFLMESDPLKEEAFQFLVQQDCVIAGNSSIHLEATLLNIWSLYFNMGDGSFIDDYYGYVKNNLVPSADNISSLIAIIQTVPSSKFDLYRKACYFNATVSTVWEGKSEELVLTSISKFIEANDPHIKA